MEGFGKEAIDKIQKLVEGQEKTVIIDGKTYSDYGLKKVYSDPRPSMLKVSTLDGIADYIKENLDGVDSNNSIIVIDSYDCISIYSPVEGERNDRHQILESNLTEVDKFPFGRFIAQEDFIIKFSALFCGNDDKSKIISAASRMQCINQTAGDDNGATTSRMASNEVLCPGIADDDMPQTVVKLKPYRTFREVEQPESAFIFRYKQEGGSPVIALFEADGGAWKLDAKAKIKAYLSDKVESPIIC